MIDVLLVVVSVLVLSLIFLRRWYLLDKAALFGRMVLKRGLRLPGRLSKQDLEVTAKEMIPDPSSVDSKLRVKGENHFKKAELELKKGHLTDAEKLYIKAIAMDPSHVPAYAKLGMIYINQEQFGKAELIYRKLVVAVNDDPVYFSNLALALFHQEKYSEAKEFYEKAIQQDASRAGRFYSLARTNHLLDEMDQAFLNIEKALTMDPDNLDYGLTLAQWQIEKDMHSDARQVLETIIQHWPENVEAKKMLQEITAEKASAPEDGRPLG